MCTSSALRVGLPPGHARRTSVSRPTTALNRSTSAAASAALHRRQGDPPSTIAEQAVVIDRRRHRLRPARDASVATLHPQVVLGRRQADPVLEGIDGLGGGEVLAHQQEPRRPGGPEPFQPFLFLGPPHQHDVGICAP